MDEQIENYLNEFEAMSKEDVPETLQDFFRKGHYKKLEGLNIATYLPKAPKKAELTLYTKFSRMITLADFANGYYGHQINDDYFFPIALVKGELACIGVLMGDAAQNILFWGQELQGLKYKDGFCVLNLTLSQWVAPAAAASKPSQPKAAKPTNSKTPTENKGAATDYLAELKKAGIQLPAQLPDYLARFEALNKKNVTNHLKGYAYASRATLQTDYKTMATLALYSQEAYNEKKAFIPLAAIKGQSAAIGIKTGDPKHQLWFFDFQDGFFKQAYTVDQFLDALK